MSRRAVFWLVGIIVAVHIGLFLFISRLPALPKVRHVPTPSFKYQEHVYENKQTGDVFTLKEFTMPTRMANPAKLPPTPKPRPVPDATPQP